MATSGNGKVAVGAVGIGALFIKMLTGMEHGCGSEAARVFESGTEMATERAARELENGLQGAARSGERDFHYNGEPHYGDYRSSRPYGNESGPAEGDRFSPNGEPKNPYEQRVSSGSSRRVVSAVGNTGDRTGKDYIVLDSKPTIEQVRTLNTKGIPFVVDKKAFEALSKVNDFEVIIVASNDDATLAEQYGLNNNQIKDFRKRLFNLQLSNAANVHVVDNAQRLDNLLVMARASNTQPVVLFNNNGSDAITDVIKKRGITNVITCNSQTLAQPHFLQSNDFIGIDPTFRSLAAANYQASLFDFYSSFCGEYKVQIFRAKAVTVTVVGGGSLTTGGGISYIVYNQNEKKKNATLWNNTHGNS